MTEKGADAEYPRHVTARHLQDTGDMAQPTPYQRLHNLTEYAEQHPSAPYNAAYVDDELNAVELTLDETLTNLAKIQRDDGKLRNQSVHLEAIATEVLAYLEARGDLRGEWEAGVSYEKRDTVTYGAATYLCVVPHTSGDFPDDLQAGKWSLLASDADISPALSALSALSPSAGRLPYFDGSESAALTPITSAARALLDDADASAMLTTLGLTAFAKALVSNADAQAARNTLYALSRTFNERSAALTGTNSYVGSLTPAIQSYEAGLYLLKAGNTNTSTVPTIALNGLEAKVVRKFGGAELVEGDIQANHVGIYWYDSDKFLLLNPAAGEANALAAAEEAQNAAAAAQDAVAALTLPDPPVASTYLKRNESNDAYEPMTPAEVMDDIGGAVGEIRFVHIGYDGATEPNPAYYVRLKSGLSGAGGYNHGKLSSESVSGSFPYITATAVIADEESPLYGKVINLDEDEARFYRAGSPGTRADDTLKSHSHTGTFSGSGTAASAGGHSHSVSVSVRSASSGNSPSLSSTGSSTTTDLSGSAAWAGAHTHSVSVSGSVSIAAAGSTETRPRYVGIAVYMRIK